MPFQSLRILQGLGLVLSMYFQKCQLFLNVVSEDGKHIDFWKFFDYMRNRTADIKNIEFTN